MRRYGIVSNIIPTINKSRWYDESDQSGLKCTRCGSTDVKVYEDHYTCNICGEKFRKAGEVTSEDIEKVFYTSTSLRAEVKRQYKDFIEKSDKDAMEARIKASKFNWRTRGVDIIGVAALVLIVLAGLSLVSMNSYLALPFAAASLVSGLIYAVVKKRRRSVHEGDELAEGGE